MRALRTLLGVLGVATFLGALGVVLVPGIAASVPTGALVDTLGNDYFVLAVFGVLMVLATVLAVLMRAISGLDQSSPPDPEEVQSAPSPGEDFNEAVAGVPVVDLPWTDDDRESIRARLYEDAVGVEMRHRNVSRADARRAVDRGEWTRDTAAAAFLSADGRGPSPGTSERVRAALRGETWFQRGAKRTARAIVDIHEGRETNEAPATHDAESASREVPRESGSSTPVHGDPRGESA